MSPFLPNSGVADTPFGMAADVRLERTDANTITLTGLPGSSKKLFVSFGNILSFIDSDLTLDTDSASDYLISESGGSVSIGSTALSALTTGYNDYTILYLYATDNNDCWNFSSPTVKDYRKALIISDNAPNEAGGWMATSGEGQYARHVGWVILNSSRQTGGAWYLASAFNQKQVNLELTGDKVDHTTAETDWDWTDNDTGSPTNDYIMVPDGWMLDIILFASVNNETAGKLAGYALDIDDVQAVQAAMSCTEANEWYQVFGSDSLEASGDSAMLCQTQTGAKSVGGSSGTVNTSDWAFNTCVIRRIPLPQTPGFTRVAFAAGDLVDIDSTVSSSPSEGDILYHNGTGWMRLPRGADGQRLTLIAGTVGWAS